MARIEIQVGIGCFSDNGNAIGGFRPQARPELGLFCARNAGKEVERMLENTDRAVVFNFSIIS